MILGTITSYSANTGVKLTIDGEASPTTKNYSFLSTYSPTVGDRVLIEEISGSYVVLGAVSKTPNVHATVADSIQTVYFGTYILEFRYRYGELEFRADNGSWIKIKTS